MMMPFSLIRRFARLVLVSVIIFPSALAQTQGVDILLSKARSLEARGRMDLAAQNWRQVLMANPNEPEALAGLARNAKENGNTAEERGYVDRLRKINPSDPAIAQVEHMKVVTPQERARLEEAGRLAMQGKLDEAIGIYRDVLGDEPPPGKWAQPYYEAETASKSEREKAIVHLRQLCSRNPKNEVYRFWLARAFAYDPNTRTEAFRMLESIHDPGTAEQARTTWRQALVWEEKNPSVRAPLEEYLQRYPDAELQNVLTALQKKQETEINASNEKHGYDALHNGDVTSAQAQFEHVLTTRPKDVDALSGLGFVRLKQKRFDEALELFDRARTLAPQRKDIQQGYSDAQFLGLLDRASAELAAGRAGDSAVIYQQALSLRPSDPQAELGLGQALMRQDKFHDAEGAFQQALTHSPNNVDAMAGLGLARMKQNDFTQALNWLDQVRKLAPGRADVREAYETSEYLEFMKEGSTALAKNHSAAAVKAYQKALAIRPRTKDTLLALARADEAKQDYPSAAQAYEQMTTADLTDMQGWLGLVWAQLKSNDARAALNSMERIPAQTKTKIEVRSDYLAEEALAYYQTNQAAQGERALNRAIQAATSSDSPDALNVRLQVGGMLLDENKPEVAIGVYKQATALHSDNSAAWEGLIGAYVRTRNISAAEAALAAMPKSAAGAVAKNPGFLRAVSSVYSADGRCEEAEDLLNRAASLDQAAGHAPALEAETDLAYLWVREQNYSKAAEKYRQIIARDSNRSDIWRAYIATLHSTGQDQLASREMQRVPRAIADELEKDPRFLSLLANVEVKEGHSTAAVRWLERSRASYQEQGEAPPADLILQLAWLRLNAGDATPSFAQLLSQTDERKDLTEKQRKAIHSIWATWAVRQAERALADKKPKQAESILLAAQGTLPGQPQIRAALSSLYMRRHEYARALNLYLSTSMTDAEASDYRAAAGAALAVHKTAMADQFIQAGLALFPRDAALLQMSGKQEASEGHYQNAERDLKLALAAMRSDDVENTSASANATANADKALSEHTAADSRMANPGDSVANSETQAPGCRPKSTEANSASIKPMALRWREPADGDADDEQSGTGNPPPQEQRTQDDIDIIKDRNTPFIGSDDASGGRTGDTGFNRLIVEDGSMGTSYTFNDQVRVGVAAHGVYLNGGTPNGSSTFQLGTLAKGVAFGEQSALGYSGVAQLSTNDFGMMFANSPQGFPVHNLLGGVRYRPGHSYFTFLLLRDNVKDSLLSYAGVRDPGTGVTWGGVMSSSGSVQFRRDTRWNGEYVNLRYSDIRGQNVADNRSVDGGAGAYFNVLQKSQASLTIGVDVGGMHYWKNLQFFTLGQGGYFSPQQYYRAMLPISVSGQHDRLEYQLAIAGGIQHFTQDSSPYYPVNVSGVSLPLQNIYYGGVDTTPSYSGTLRTNYRVTDHVNFGLFATVNNERNFATASAGFSLKFLFHRVPTNPELQVRSVPDWLGNQPLDLGLKR